MVTSNKYIVQNMERLSFYNLEDGSCYFMADDLQEATMTNEQEIVYANGKNGTKIGSAARNKASRITATNGAIIAGVMAVQVGTKMATGTYVTPGYIETLTLASDKTVTLTHKPFGTTGAEVPYIYKKNSDGTLGTAYAIDTVASATKFSFAPTTNKLSCPTGMSAGDEVVVIYDIQSSNTNKVTNAENKFSLTGKLVADCFFKDICTDKSYFGKIVYNKAQASGNFDFSFGNDPSVQSMEFEALAGGCQTGSTKNLWELYIFDEEDITDLA